MEEKLVTLAIRTYQRLGFVPEGVRRASAVVVGERWDTAMMSLLRTELPGSRLPAAGA